MQFLLANSFSESLARLSNQEQKAAKLTAMDVRLNPASPGHQFHRLDKAKDADFWSVRVNDDLRLIVHRRNGNLLLCYVGHHDDAYRWAERRRIEQHPTTGAMQLVEIRERVEELPPAAMAPAPGPRLFDAATDDELLAYGVPSDWIADVRQATEDTLFDLTPHLPAEAAEALLELAVGGMPAKTPLRPTIFDGLADSPSQIPPDMAGFLRLPPAPDPFAHPDAQRRFRVLENAEELARALEAPWERWIVFLHPAQRALVERRFGGPARVSGSAGTGKTIVALHRAVYLARRQPGTRVLLTTFSKTLASALQRKLVLLGGNDPDLVGRITVQSVTGIAYDLYSRAFGQPNLASPAVLQSLLQQAAAAQPARDYPQRLLLSEWQEVVDAWQLESWEDYRSVARLGRKTRVGEKQRAALWAIFAEVRRQLAQRKLVTWSQLLGRLAAQLGSGTALPFEHIVVDEAQDLSVAEGRFLAALGGGRPDALFFAGDLGQRIFQQPFSWRALGLDVRGRSQRLRVNYRTSHQIRAQADRLLPGVLSDVDGEQENRRGTVSVFDGPPPVIGLYPTVEAEGAAVGEWLARRLADGFRPEEIGLFVRGEAELARARAAAKAAGTKAAELSEKFEVVPGKLIIGTMHLAKGLEFRAVAVMACDDEVIPSQARIEAVADDADLEEVYTTERHLLYVACTRARDQLLVTGVEPGSEFLGDLV